MELEIDVLFGRILFGLIGVAVLILVVIYLVEKFRNLKKDTSSYSFSTGFASGNSKTEVNSNKGIISKHLDEDIQLEELN